MTTDCEYSDYHRSTAAPTALEEDSGPLSQRSAHAEQYAQTKTNHNPEGLTLTDTGGVVLTLC